MATYQNLRKAAGSAAIIAAVALLAGCHQSGEAHSSKAMFPHEDGDPIVRADTFPRSLPDSFDQSPPQAPLFGKTDYLRERQVWPVALADTGEALPLGVPLAPPQQNIEVIQPQASTAKPSEEQGGSAPAAGWSQGITNAQGDGENSKLDADKTK